MKQTWFTNINSALVPTDILGIIVILGVLGLFALAYWQLRKRALVIRQGEVAVMFNQKRGTFSGFLPAGRHLILPRSDRHLKGTISTCRKALRGITKVYSRDGFPITLNWALAYRLNPGSIDRVMQPSMADILLANPTRMAELQTIHCLEKIVGQHSLQVLRRDGVHQKVNTCTTRSVVDCLSAYGIVVSEIKIGLVQWPRNPGVPARVSIPDRLSEGDLSQLAEPRPSQLNRSGGSLNQVQPPERSSAPAAGESNTQEISYYDAMAWDTYQHTELQSDQPPGKLVL